MQSIVASVVVVVTFLPAFSALPLRLRLSLLLPPNAPTVRYGDHSHTKIAPLPSKITYIKMDPENCIRNGFANGYPTHSHFYAACNSRREPSMIPKALEIATVQKKMPPIPPHTFVFIEVFVIRDVSTAGARRACLHLLLRGWHAAPRSWQETNRLDVGVDLSWTCLFAS